MTPAELTKYAEDLVHSGLSAPERRQIISITTRIPEARVETLLDKAYRKLYPNPSISKRSTLKASHS